MKKLLIVLASLVGLLVVAGAGILWLLEDPNRFKPELERLITESSGFEVRIKGDLAWQLWPPVVLSASDIAFSDDDTEYHLGSLGLNAGLLSLLSGGELVIDDLVLQDLVMTDRKLGDVTRVHRLSMARFTPGQPGPLALNATLEDADGTETDVALATLATLDMDAGTLKLQDADITYDGTDMRCQIDAAGLNRDPIRPHTPTRDDLLPLDTFRSLDWVADCSIPRFELADTAVTNISVTSKNTRARSQTAIVVPQMMGGSLNLEVAIDAQPATPKWDFKNSADGIQSQQVMNVLSPKLAWAAPLLVGGTFQARGITAEQLASSFAGAATIDAGKGMIDISMIKSSLLTLAQMAGKTEKIAAWPDQLNYEKLVADWVVNGKTHAVDMALDNARLLAKGEFDPLTDALDMRGSVTVEKNETLDSFKIDPALYGVPIPIRCVGSLAEPDCGLDRDAAKQTVAAIARGQVRERADEKIDEVLEDKVPEELRDTARNVLKGLGGLLEKKQE